MQPLVMAGIEHRLTGMGNRNHERPWDSHRGGGAQGGVGGDRRPKDRLPWGSPAQADERAFGPVNTPPRGRASEP